ncbi:MAG: branched-chain amino acid ABC transporter permease [Rhodobacteraceae bacterium]|nr:branched-chain amino acid ABC transporter permease [Paracoccaceae bacterium]
MLSSEKNNSLTAAPRKLVIVLAVVAIVFLLTAPWVVPALSSKFWLNVISEMLIWSLFAASVNVLFGYVGLLSFGQALFFGLGAYTYAITTVHLGWGFWPAVAACIVVPTVGAGLVGLFAVRLSAHYFNILTVIFSLAFFYLAVSAKEITGGDDGLPFAAPRAELPFGWTIEFRDAGVQYFFILMVVVLCFYLKHRVVSSRLGLSLTAVRDNHLRASLVGYNVYLVRLSAFIFAGFLAGVAGMLFAIFSRYASTSYFYYTTSGEGVVYMIVGGAGHLFGPVIGATSVILLREFLSAAWENYLLVVGVIIILCTRYAPEGLAGIWAAILARLTGKGERV